MWEIFAGSAEFYVGLEAGGLVGGEVGEGLAGVGVVGEGFRI